MRVLDGAKWAPTMLDSKLGSGAHAKVAFWPNLEQDVTAAVSPQRRHRRVIPMR
jgi:hypothetical protein